MTEIFEQLKEWLKWRRENYINDTEFYQDSGCTTCGGDWTEVAEIDEEALWAEIDAFAASFKEKQQ